MGAYMRTFIHALGRAAVAPILGDAGDYADGKG